jgi:hypothetical protein
MSGLYKAGNDCDASELDFRRPEPLVKALQARCPRVALAVWHPRGGKLKITPEVAGTCHPKAPCGPGASRWRNASGGIEAKWVAAAWPTGNVPRVSPDSMMKVSVQS